MSSFLFNRILTVHVDSLCNTYNLHYIYRSKLMEFVSCSTEINSTLNRLISFTRNLCIPMHKLLVTCERGVAKPK